MNRAEHLLSILAEECAEVAQRVSKVLRFGPEETEPGKPQTNADRVMAEYHDLQAAIAMLQDEGVLPVVRNGVVVERILAKRAKVEQYLAYSSECGTLQPPYVHRSDG